MTVPPPPVVAVMGVAGCGKTTIGQLLAEHLEVPFAEADALHPDANVEKMAQGVPLDDHDREPWLDAVAERIAASRERGLVVSCSALKRRYRDRLRRADASLVFVHLTLDERTATARVARRRDHFMPATLVASQFATLEPLQPDEAGLAVPATLAPAGIVATVVRWLAR